MFCGLFKCFVFLQQYLLGEGPPGILVLISVTPLV